MSPSHRLVTALLLGCLALCVQKGHPAEPAPTQGPRQGSVLIPSPSSPLVSLRFVFRVGSQNDPKGKEGLATLTAALVAEGGTRSLSYDRLLEKFYPMAAAIDGTCRKEVTVFLGTVHRDNLTAYLPLATEMLTAPRFAPEDFERLRNEALDYVTKTLRGNNDEELGKLTLQGELYQGHPYGHPDRGTAQGLNAITLADVKDFHKKCYTREALTLGMAGDFGSPGAVESSLISLPTKGLFLPKLEPPRPTRGLDVKLVTKPAEATAISIGFPIDFEATRSFLLNYSKLWVQTLSRRLGYAIDGHFYGRKDLVTELAERLPRLTVDQVNAAVRKHLRPAGMKVAIVAQNADELREILDCEQANPDDLRHAGHTRRRPGRGQADRRVPAQGRHGQGRTGGADVREVVISCQLPVLSCQLSLNGSGAVTAPLE